MREDQALEIIERELLTNKTYLGTFYSFSTYDVAPNPGLTCRNPDLHIALPLHDRDAALLEAHGSPAPYGKGEATVINEEVRKTTQFDAKEIVIRNPGFNEWLSDDILPDVCTTLGISNASDVQAHLYKLLLYPKGGHFAMHRDTQKEDGMFGTMAVLLPSKFTGGILKVAHSGEELDFEIEDTEFTTSVMAWYADVKHSVSPVSSGYRLALTYNLIMSPTKKSQTTKREQTTDIPTASSLSEKQSLRSAFSTLLRNSKGRKIAYVLSHAYSESSLDSLKGRDRFVVDSLAALTENMQCDIYVAQLEVYAHGYQSGDDNKYNEDVDLVSPIVQYTVRNSRPLFLDTPMIRYFGRWEEKDIFPKGVLKTLQPESEEEEETGNEGVVVDKWYRAACVVLLPKKKDSEPAKKKSRH